LQAAQAQAQTKALSKSLQIQRKKIELKKSPSLLKIKNTQPHKPTRQEKGQKNSTTTMVYRHERQEHQHPTAVLQKWRCSASYDSFS